jgi:hypothetical protein
MNKLEPLAPETEVIIFDPQADFVPGEQIPGKSGTAHTTHKVEMAKWDFNLNDNRFPKEAFELIYSDKDAPQIIQRLVYFALGKGELLLFKRTETQPEIVTITEIEAWKRKNKRKLSNFLWNIATNFYTYGNYFTEYVMTNDRKEVADFHAIDAHNVRAEKVNPNSGRIENYYIATFEQSHDWKKYTIVPAFNEMNPTVKPKFILHGKVPTPGNPYYGIPVWVGGVEQMMLRKRITEYYSKGLDNGFNVKYMLKIHPEFYKGCKTQEERDTKKAALVADLNDALSGTKNSGKTVAVDMVVDHIVKELTGVVEIHPIANNLNDTSYNNILQQSNSNVPANFGISSTLAGIERSSQLSSGSEVLNQYNVHLAINVPQPRALILQAIEIIFELNGWSEKYADQYDYIGFEDIQLVMQQESKSGIMPPSN